MLALRLHPTNRLRHQLLQLLWREFGGFHRNAQERLLTHTKKARPSIGRARNPSAPCTWSPLSRPACHFLQTCPARLSSRDRLGTLSSSPPPPRGSGARAHR